MKCFTLGLLTLLFSFSVQAAEQTTTYAREKTSPDVATSKNEGANNSQNDRQFFLPSGSSAIPINVNYDNEKVEYRTETIKETSAEPIKDIDRAPKAVISIDSVKEKWGVDNFRVRQTSAGYMLDVRYRVFDKEKAKPLFSRKLHPFVIVEASGVKYGVPASPKVGFLRQAPSHITENKEYFLMIANPNKRIKTGDKLTLVIGDFRIAHLTVE